MRFRQGIDLYEDAISWTPFRSAAHAHSAGTVLALPASRRARISARRAQAPPTGRELYDFCGERSGGGDAALSVPSARRLARIKLFAPARGAGSRTSGAFHAELAPHLPALAPLWTHNDLHASNLFWSDAGPKSDANAHATAMIDFGLADRTNAVHDIAHAIERNIVEWLALVNNPAHPDDVPIHLDHLDALLDGYESVRPLSSEESAALAPMVALCHAEFALSEADYFLGVLHSEEKAQMAYDGWLVGHARWFQSAAGRKLLDALRRRAEPKTWGAPRGMTESGPAMILDAVGTSRRLPRLSGRSRPGARWDAITAAFGIWLTTRRLLICWPVTLVSIFLYMVVFFQAGLFSDALLQVFFVVFTFYGWWHWWRGVRDEGEVRVVALPRSHLVDRARAWRGAGALCWERWPSDCTPRCLTWTRC